MKINYAMPRADVVYVRPNGIDAPWEIIDGSEFEPMGMFSSRDEAVSFALEMARRSHFIVHEADVHDTIVGTWNLKA